MPFIDTAAAATVRQLREERGLSPEALAREVRLLAERENWKLGTVDAFTIRRLEGNDERYPAVPTIRVQAALGAYFGVPHHEIWRESNRVWVGSLKRERVAV